MKKISMLLALFLTTLSPSIYAYEIDVTFPGTDKEYYCEIDTHGIWCDISL